MSERDIRKRNIPANRRSTNTTVASRPSPSPRRKVTPLPRSKPSRPSVDGNKLLKRSKSEPSLWISGGRAVDQEAVVAEEDEGILYRPQTCTDIFSPSEISIPQSPQICSQGYNYNKDAKVVVNVAVEGSPGPIRTMVKLGYNIEETIKVVVNKYNEEGRTPRLDKDAASTSELHHSYFSLHSLSKSDLIGDVGSRSFYLRTNNSNYGIADDISVSSSNQDSTQVIGSNHQLPNSTLTNSLPVFIQPSIRKIIRKFWNFFGCLPCSTV